MKNKIYFIIFLLWGCAAPISAPHAADLLGISAENHQETITLDVAEKLPRKVFLLPSPDRLVVDVPSLRGHPAVSLPPSYGGDLIKDVRFGQFNHETSRFVFDLRQPVHVVRTEEAEEGLVITIAGAGEKPQHQAREKPVLRAPEKAKVQAAPPPVSARVEKHELTAPKRHAPETKIERGAIDLPPKKPVIIIDPGHGGVDPGTIGPDGTEEKNVTLRYALALRAQLLKTGRYVVRMTHDDDQFIMLRQRVAIARKDHGSIFISLHADSAPEMSARGLSVYTVSERASDEETEALAARENKADVLAGVDLSDERDDVAGILISLAARETKNRSATLADELVLHLGDRVQLLSNTHRFAGFAVLKAPDVPSVLIELAFLSNPKDERLLKSPAYRDKVAKGIVAGVDAYFHQLKLTGDK